MVINLLQKLDIENGGTGAPSVVTPGQRWIFKGFVGASGGSPAAGQFKVNGGALTTYGLNTVIGSNDHPSIDLSMSPIGTYIFEYNIPSCNIGSTLTLTNSCPIPPPPTCNSGTASNITVCNASCSVNLFDHLMGGPESTGAWSKVSGSSTLVFGGGHLGTVNFSGITAGTYVVRYTVGTCTTDMTVTVVAPPSVANGTNDNLCDNYGVIDLNTYIGGAGTWSVVGNTPPFGIVDLVNGHYTPGKNDGGSVFGTGITYTFKKSVTTSGVTSECGNACIGSGTVNLTVYPGFNAGQNAFNNVICNDGTTRKLRDLLVGEDAGGTWQFFGALDSNFEFINPITILVNGSSQTLDVFGSRELNGGDDPTVAFTGSNVVGEYQFRYLSDPNNQNQICAASPSGVRFQVQNCGGLNCNGNQPTINKSVSGNCVSANRGGSLSSSIASETWEYRTSASGTWSSYTPNTNVCNESYVEFRFTLTFNGGCPSIQRSVSHTFINNSCNNNPTVSGQISNCQFTMTGGSAGINSPIASDLLQYRYQGSNTWLNYASAVNFTGTATIEYRRIVNYGDGCTQSITGTQTVTGQCGSSCSVSVAINGNNNLLTANTTGCGNAGQTLNWYYSSNGTTYGGIIGTGFTYVPTQDGYYKVILTCGSCTSQAIYQFTGTVVNPPAPCTGNLVMSFANNVITATRVGCSGTVSYDWRFSASGSGWATAMNNNNSPNHIPSDGPGYYRVFTYCDGLCLLVGDYQVTGTICNNAPTVTAQFNSATCQWTLTRGGTVQCDMATDTLWWRPAGSVDLHQYTVPFTYQGDIQVQRDVTCFGGCPNVTTPWSQTYVGGTCCTGNTMDVNASFNQANCLFTLSLVTNVTNTILNDIVQWKTPGGGWNNYQGPFTGSGTIIYRRIVTFVGGACSTLETPEKTIDGSCCTGNNPTVSGSYSSITGQYTITSGGTNSSTIATDVIEWKPQGGNNWTTYTGPFAGPATIDIRRTVTYTDGCNKVATAVASGTGCNNNPGVSCGFNPNTCLLTLSPTGGTVSPIQSDIIRWRVQGNTAWNVYSSPISNPGTIEYYREVIFTGNCPTVTSTVQSCGGTCCTGNNPDVSAAFDGGTCRFTLTPNGNNASPVLTDIIEWRPLNNGNWTTYIIGQPFSYVGTIEYRRTVTYSNGCATAITAAHQSTGVCCSTNSATVLCNFNNQTCQYTLSKGGQSTSAISSDKIYWRPISGGQYVEYIGSFNHVGQIQYYREVIYSDGCTTITTAAQSCNGACCGSNTPGVVCVFNPTDCKYTISPTGNNVSTVVTDVLQWKAQGSNTWNNYTVPFTGPANIDVQRLVTYSDSCTANPTSSCSGTCCLGSDPEATGSYSNVTCQYTLQKTGSNGSTPVSDIIRWRNQGSNGAWNTYSVPFSNNTSIEYQRVVVYANGCPQIIGALHYLSGTCCNGNDPDVQCAFNASNCNYTLNRIGNNTSTISSDKVYYRATGTNNAWIEYNAPFTFNGGIDYYRQVIYSDGCATKTSAQHTCSGDCCTNLSVSTSINVSNQLVANVSGCPGSVSIAWYYSQSGDPTTLIGNGSTMNPINGSGIYKAVASCSNGCVASSTITFSCNSNASLSTSNTTLTVTGLSGCNSPTYQWEYSVSGSGGWSAATGSSGSSSLNMQNGNGYYRVTILCGGICPVVLSYHRDCNCSQNPISVAITKNGDFTLFANVNGCDGNTSYTWLASNGGVIISGQGGSGITTNGTGIYNLNIQCNNNCGSQCNSNTVFQYECLNASPGLGTSATLRDTPCWIDSQKQWCIKTATIAFGITLPSGWSDLVVDYYKLRYTTEAFDRDVTSYANIVNITSTKVEVRSVFPAFLISDTYDPDNGTFFTTSENNMVQISYKANGLCYKSSIQGGGRIVNEFAGTIEVCNTCP